MNLNYSTNDLFFDVDKILANKGSLAFNGTKNIWRKYPKSKTGRIISLASDKSSLNTSIAIMKEEDVQDYGIMYLTWLIENKKFLKAKSVAMKLSLAIPDNYFLAYVNYWISSEQGENKEAIKHLYQGLQYAPTDTLLYYFLLESAIVDKNFEMAVLTLDVLNNSFNYNLTRTDIALIKKGEAFINSKQYKQWEKNQI